MSPDVRSNHTLPRYLHHYYEAEFGPLRNLSRLSVAQAEAVMASIRQRGRVFAAKRSADYVTVRRELEEQVRAQFVAKGGHPRLERPHYMTLGACPWLMQWYERGLELRVPVTEFDDAIVSFTYGDMFPAMRLRDGKPHRGIVFTLGELPDLIASHGLPQVVNVDGACGPERYIEAQVWDDGPLLPYLG